MKGIHPSIVSHKLNVFSTARPVRQKIRRFHPDRQNVIRSEIDKLLEAGFIREIYYPDWLANVVMVPKKEGKWRVCVDYTNLNNACPKDSFPLPRIDQIVDSTSGQGMPSFLDTFSGYHQILMSPDDEEKTTFITPHDLYYYKVMPFGLKNAGATYQRLMIKIFKPLIGHTVEVYIDDIVVKNPRAACPSLTRSFSPLTKGHRSQPESSQGSHGNTPSQEQEGATTAHRQARRTRRFIARFTDELRPFFLAIRKAGAHGWTDSCQNAFEKIKHCLMQPPILSNPIPNEKLYMYLAVSEWAVSAILFRCPSPKKQKPIYYVSRALADVETRYSKIELTALALRSAAQKLRPYFQAHPVIVLTDQPLRNILHKPDLTGRMLQWAIELSEFGIDFQPRLSMKGQVMADFNGGLCELMEPHAHQALELGSYYSPQLGNIWSKPSVWDSLPLTMKHNMRPSCLDWTSPLLYPSPNSGYTTTHNSWNTLQQFTEWTIEKIKRTDNRRADALAGIAASLPIKEAILLPIHVQTNPSVAEVSTCNTIEANQADDQEWTYNIAEYLLTGTLAGDPTHAHKIRAQYVLAELHEGVCGNHSGGRSLAHRAHSQGYYWPTMKKDAAAYVKKCDKCQRYAPIPHMPSATLKSISGPWPFAQWGMDIVGPFPTAPAQKKYLLVATDYFSKWVEAEAYASIKDKDVTKFVWKNIVCRFGIPQTIIADNGPQFDSIAFRNFYSELNIRNSYCTPRYPQSNRQAEATNKTLITALKKRLEQAKGKWVEELPDVLWAYRTTPGRPSRNTPFALAYGMDAVIPTEIGLPTIRTDAAKQNDANTEFGRNLDWTDEVRESAAIRMADYQQRASAHYNRKVKPRSFKNGTLVLRKVFENTAEVGVGKFQANWEGPYIVSKASESGAYHLQKLDGTPLLRPWNVSNLKQYYQ
uniref:Integrase catalytic domain-containing protein n=1 Tax=Vitis vinifera TaxID=29760 RepID=A5C2K0_VITVI|nr:hypothetical protein VITISV_015420 [Vitis vinifera]